MMDGDQEEDLPTVSSLDVLAMSWVFTQRQPLDTGELIREAKKRGIDVDELMLRQLYRQQLLIPLVAVTSRQCTEPRSPDQPEPGSRGTSLFQLRQARQTGRVMDLVANPFRARLRFTAPRPYMSGWWNGLLYSHHQLSLLPHLRAHLARRSFSCRSGRLYPRLPQPDAFLRHRASWYHRISLMATALEARYLPVLDLRAGGRTRRTRSSIPAP